MRADGGLTYRTRGKLQPAAREKKLISELQRGLGIRVNGRFGGRTESAVIDWQAIHNERGEVVSIGKEA